MKLFTSQNHISRSGKISNFHDLNQRSRHVYPTSLVFLLLCGVVGIVPRRSDSDFKQYRLRPEHSRPDAQLSTGLAIDWGSSVKLGDSRAPSSVSACSPRRFSLFSFLKARPLIGVRKLLPLTGVRRVKAFSLGVYGILLGGSTSAGGNFSSRSWRRFAMSALAFDIISFTCSRECRSFSARWSRNDARSEYRFVVVLGRGTNQLRTAFAAKRRTASTRNGTAIARNGASSQCTAGRCRRSG